MQIQINLSETIFCTFYNKKFKYTGDNANQVLERKITNSVALLLPFFMPFRLSTLECTIFQNKKIIARNIPLKHSS